MTDRELLELAAKAAGYEFGEINGAFKARIEQDFGTCGTYGCQKHQWRDWNPLTDDSDALRLAVALGRSDMVLIEIGRAGASVEFDSSEVCALETGDTNVAIRRAIVRAAAEIGRQHD